MIYQCKQCGKKYRIDDDKLVKNHMFFKCSNCKNKVHVIKPKRKKKSIHPDISVIPFLNKSNMLNFHNPTGENGKHLTSENLSSNSKSKIIQNLKNAHFTDITVNKKLLFVFLIFFVLTISIVTTIYMMLVPALLNYQINLRTYSITRSFSAAVQEPLLIKNYLIVNKIAEINAELPGVAYVLVLNEKGIIIAGIFGDKKRFDSNFINNVNESGFPWEISTQNRIPTGKNESTSNYLIGGKKIHDVAVRISDTGSEAHVGLFIEDTENVENTVRKSLTPLVLSLIIVTLIGCLSLFLVARSISIPIQSLTQAADKISLGEVDLPIQIKGSGEIRELATSLERMRFSVNAALNRVQRRPPANTLTR
jgi:predicted Zn finger-like uncharacterized protein